MAAARRRGILRVPDEQRSALEILAKLSDTQVESILDLLQNSERTISLERVGRRIAESTGLTARQGAELLTVLGSLTLSQSSLGLDDPDEMAAEVVRAASVAGIEGLSESKELAAALERNLRRLLDLRPALEPLAKGAELLFSYPSLLQESRIFTDIRPVFTEHESPKPIASVITHTLQLQTTEGLSDRDHTLYISMDIRDLRSLKEVVDRAISKDEALRSSLKRTSLTALALD